MNNPKNFRNALLFCLFLFGLPCAAQQQKVSDADWDVLIQTLTSEKWADAEKLSHKYLERFVASEDTLEQPSILRYMYLRCVAAQLGEKKYEKEEALEKTKSCIGKRIITVPKTFYEECMFNCFKLSDDKQAFFSCSTNINKTIIQIFETYELSDPEILKDTSPLFNKEIRIWATIAKITAEGFTMPRLNITFSGAQIEVAD
jgi:hypothetical protein